MTVKRQMNAVKWMTVLAMLAFVSGGAQAAPEFVDPGFADGSWTITEPPGDADPWDSYGNDDGWVDQSEWSASDGWLVNWTDWASDHYEDVFRQTSGGAGDNGAFAAIHANYGARGFFQVFHDQKDTTGIVPLALDVKTFDNANATVDSGSTMTVQVVGLPDPWSQYALSRMDPPSYPDETILKTIDIDVTTVFDWTTITEDVDFGAGHEYLVVDIRSGGHDGWNVALPAVGVDNVAFVPEPATLGLLALGGAAIIRRRRR
jgi:hypothetical protein